MDKWLSVNLKLHSPGMGKNPTIFEVVGFVPEAAVKEAQEKWDSRNESTGELEKPDADSLFIDAACEAVRRVYTQIQLRFETPLQASDSLNGEEIVKDVGHDYSENGIKAWVIHPRP